MIAVVGPDEIALEGPASIGVEEPHAFEAVGLTGTPVGVPGATVVAESDGTPAGVPAGTVAVDLHCSPAATVAVSVGLPGTPVAGLAVGDTAGLAELDALQAVTGIEDGTGMVRSGSLAARVDFPELALPPVDWACIAAGPSCLLVEQDEILVDRGEPVVPGVVSVTVVVPGACYSVGRNDCRAGQDGLRTGRNEPALFRTLDARHWVAPRLDVERRPSQDGLG